jgi:ABC-type branched-subunit amino acid transport system substrate-binding protein
MLMLFHPLWGKSPGSRRPPRPGLLVLLVAAPVFAQSIQPCACGSNPPGRPANRELHPYAGAPADERPFSNYTKPYYENYNEMVQYNGAARDVPTVPASAVDEVRIGFLGPVENHPDQALGRMMLNGAQMAVDERNAAGAYAGKPFRLMIHNDAAIWGASSNEMVKMAYDDKVWAMLGSISGDSTHIALRVSLKAEVPMVNSASTDPTLPETSIPWYLTTVQDDRVQGYTLARRIYTDLGLKRIALLRVNDRYGRFGVAKFRDASRRLGHPVVIEQKYLPADTDFRRSLRIINESGVDGIVLWGDAPAAAQILRQMRELGMKQRVFGSFRVLGDDLTRVAGAAAEGLEVVYPFDPTRDEPTWLSFRARFEKQFGKPPDAIAALTFDTMNILLDAICRAGLNRGVIRDALAGLEHYKGVTGEMSFDPNVKNIAPMYLATLHNGKFTFRRYSMEKEYAKVGDGGVAFNGPALPDIPGPKPKIALFGPAAASNNFDIVHINPDQPWGKAATELTNAILSENVLAIVAVGRNESHLAEQLAAKLFLPVIAVSADHDLTSVNIPWIVRAESEAEALRLLSAAFTKSGANRDRLRAALNP